MRRELLGPIAWPVIILAAAALAVLAWQGWRATARRQQYRACMLLGMWMIMLAGIGYHGYNRSPKQTYGNKADADRLFEASHGLPVYYLVREAEHIVRPQYAFYMYARRVIRPLPEAKLREPGQKPFLVIARDKPENRQLLERDGYQLALSVDEKDWTWLVYRSPSAESAAEPTP